VVAEVAGEPVTVDRPVPVVVVDGDVLVLGGHAGRHAGVVLQAVGAAVKKQAAG
jgi:hypothetical protein